MAVLDALCSVGLTLHPADEQQGQALFAAYLSCENELLDDDRNAA